MKRSSSCATSSSILPGPYSPRWALKRSTVCSGTPAWPKSAGRSSRSRKRRFQQTRRRSLSNTLMPWATFSTVASSRSRLYWSAAVASSSSRSALPAPTLRRSSASASTRRADAAPIALASSRSVWRTRCRSASAGGRQRARPLGRELRERAPRPVGAQIARGHRLQLADLDRAAPQARGGVALAPVGVDERARLQALDRLRHAGQRDRDVGQRVGQQAPEHAVRQRVEVQPEQMLRPQPADPERAGLEQRHRQPAGLRERGHQQRVGPDRRKPSVTPASAPWWVASRQIRPPRNAGANCATAAKLKSPIEASANASPTMR